MKAQDPRILIVDAHPIIRDGLANLFTQSLKCEEISACGNFAEAWRQIESSPFDLVVSDFLIFGETVISFLGRLTESALGARCLIYSGADEMQVGYPCMRAGAAGFVSKAAPVKHVLKAAETVLDDRHYVSAALARLLMNQKGGQQPTAGAHLSRRELEVFTMIGTGLTVSQIAKRLGISVRTVEAHRENIKNKLHCANASQLVAAAARWLDETSVSI